MTRYTKDQPQSIQSLFNHIAEKYDRTNAILSFNFHRRWNDKMVKKASCFPSSFSMLDLCAGTGEIAFNCLKKKKSPSQAYLIDFSSGMLEVAKKKSENLDLLRHQIHYIEADAQSIPLSNESIDFATVAYGIRNIQSPSKCFEEVYRVLKPKGIFTILELTRPQNFFLKFFHQIYLSLVLPVIGKIATNNKSAYEYLSTSIHQFISPIEMKALLLKVGFEKIEINPLSGGIATLITAYKT